MASSPECAIMSETIIGRSPPKKALDGSLTAFRYYAVRIDRPIFIGLGLELKKGQNSRNVQKCF